MKPRTNQTVEGHMRIQLSGFSKPGAISCNYGTCVLPDVMYRRIYYIKEDPFGTVDAGRRGVALVHYLRENASVAKVPRARVRASRSVPSESSWRRPVEVRELIPSAVHASMATVHGLRIAVVGDSMDTARWIRVGSEAPLPLESFGAQAAAFWLPVAALAGVRALRLTVCTEDGEPLSRPATLRVAGVAGQKRDRETPSADVALRNDDESFRALVGDLTRLERRPSHGLQGDEADRDVGIRLLHAAALCGDADLAVRLLAEGADADGGAGDLSPLALAASRGHAAVCAVLLASGASPLGVEGGPTPAAVARGNGFEELGTALEAAANAPKPLSRPILDMVRTALANPARAFSAPIAPATRGVSIATTWDDDGNEKELDDEEERGKDRDAQRRTEEVERQLLLEHFARLSLHDRVALSLAVRRDRAADTGLFEEIAPGLTDAAVEGYLRGGETPTPGTNDESVANALDLMTQEERTDVEREARRIQSNVRAWLYRKSSAQLDAARATLANLFLAYAERRRFLNAQAATRTMQASWRGHVARRQVAEIRRSAAGQSWTDPPRTISPPPSRRRSARALDVSADTQDEEWNEATFVDDHDDTETDHHHHHTYHQAISTSSAPSSAAAALQAQDDLHDDLHDDGPSSYLN